MPYNFSRRAFLAAASGLPSAAGLSAALAHPSSPGPPGPAGRFRGELARAGDRLRGLVELAKEYRVQIGFHNHEEYIGAPMWDIASVIEPLDPAWIGYYFDVRHATAEGGVGCWKISTNLVSRRLKM